MGSTRGKNNVVTFLIFRDGSAATLREDTREQSKRFALARILLCDKSVTTTHAARAALAVALTVSKSLIVSPYSRIKDG